MQFRHYILMMAVMLLAACQNLPKPEEALRPGSIELQKNSRGQFSAPEFAAQQQVRSQITAWQLNGSFSYVDPQESGAGRLQWGFQGRLLDSLRLNDVVENEKVRLIGPIGTGSVELNSTENQAMLTSGRKQFSGANVEELLFRIVGWQMPVQEMRFWLFGMPSPNSGGRFWLNEQGMLQALQQSDWEIQFDRYQLMPELQQMLPTKITAIHRQNQAKVKLVIKRFQAELLEQSSVSFGDK